MIRQGTDPGGFTRPRRRGWTRGGRRITRLLLPTAVAAAVVLPGAAGAAGGSTLYVDRNGAACSDAGAGTSSQPFCTIGAAAARVTGGQTVQVAAGTYPEAVTVSSSGTSTAPIMFTAAPGATVTLSGQANGFTISGRSWVTIDGFSVTGTSGYGFDVSSSSHITISNNHITNAGQPSSGKTAGGIRFGGVTDSLISGNTADHNSDYGIQLTSGSTRNEVRANLTFSNAEGYQRAAAGIRLYSSPGNTVDRNVSHHNEDSGIESYTGSNNTLLYDNVTYGNGDHGIDNYRCTGQRVIANTVHGNVTAGINVEGGSTGATLANNISVDNGINSPRTHSDIRIESGSTSGTTMDYDQVYLSTTETLLIWDSVSYGSLAAFRSASGQETHGVQADPLWKNPAAGDFHLTAGSRAIDSANSGASDQPDTDVEGHARVDDPATLNTGAGPRLYDDRGAYEYQPVDAAPTAALTTTPSSGQPPLVVTADASASTDADATPIATYSFDFGDGSPPIGPQSGATATHQYAAQGTYTVTVTVTDSGGLSSTATSKVVVTDAPSAALAVTPSAGVVDLAVTADASASTDTDASPIAGYSFDFGDGSAPVGPQAGATATHTYTAAGAYTVTVTVTDTDGNASTATAAVTVTDRPPAAALAVTPSSGTAPLTVTADASASTDTDGTPIGSYSFDFGDGSPSIGPQGSATATHAYTQAGTYTVTVTVADIAGNASKATATVKVAADAAPIASLTVSPSTGRAPLAVTADASGSTDGDGTPIARYSFNFGDGSPVVTQSGPRAAHTYTASGNFNLTVTVTDTAGLAGTATKRVKAR